MPRAFGYEGGSIVVGSGRFGPVPPAVWEYEVSGLKVVPSWHAGRMLQPSGRTSSPLDALRPEAWTETLTQELLELLKAQFSLRMQLATQQLGNTSQIGKVRRDIARVRTILREKAGQQ